MRPKETFLLLLGLNPRISLLFEMMELTKLVKEWWIMISMWHHRNQKKRYFALRIPLVIMDFPLLVKLNCYHVTIVFGRFAFALKGVRKSRDSFRIFDFNGKTMDWQDGSHHHLLLDLKVKSKVTSLLKQDAKARVSCRWCSDWFFFGSWFTFIISWWVSVYRQLLVQPILEIRLWHPMTMNGKSPTLTKVTIGL